MEFIYWVSILFPLAGFCYGIVVRSWSLVPSITRGVTSRRAVVCGRLNLLRLRTKFLQKNYVFVDFYCPLNHYLIKYCYNIIGQILNLRICIQ